MQISVGCCEQNAPQGTPRRGMLQSGYKTFFSLLYKLTELKYVHKSVDAEVIPIKYVQSKENLIVYIIQN